MTRKELPKISEAELKEEYDALSRNRTCVYSNFPETFWCNLPEERLLYGHMPDGREFNRLILDEVSRCHQCPYFESRFEQVKGYIETE